MSPYDRLRELGVELGSMTPPAASYAPFALRGDQLFLSGHLARRGGAVWAGRLGEGITLEDGRAAARAVAVDLLTTMHEALGDLDRIEAIVRLGVMVASTSDFKEQHLVANGASELLSSVFPAANLHARSAFGVAQLPLGACVEVDLIAALRPGGAAR